MSKSLVSMCFFSVVTLALSFGTCASYAQTTLTPVNSDETPEVLVASLHQKRWDHGAEDCSLNVDPAIDIYRYDTSSYILRQNKCLSFEAPFIYVLFGKEKVLVLDTGAAASSVDFPLFDTVETLIKDQPLPEGNKVWEIVVIHSHSHSDHRSGDAQFEKKNNVTLVQPNVEAVSDFFDFKNWPNGEANIVLGDRTVTVIPTPGHQEAAISIYDPQTKWLLSGDSFYPGYLVIKHWDNYKRSIARLISFSKKHEISAVMGAHIEMTRSAGKYYPIGTIYQPNEAPLALTLEHLSSLNSALKDLDQPKNLVFDSFIVAPMTSTQKVISNVARWIIQKF
jgi:hydroxyacylglutathione hydrolase